MRDFLTFWWVVLLIAGFIWPPLAVAVWVGVLAFLVIGYFQARKMESKVEQ